LTVDSQRGISPDGRVCWLGSPEGIDVFTCATGQKRFRHPTAELAHAVWAMPSGIFVQDLGQVRLLDPTTGAVRWKKPLPPDTIGMPAEGWVPPSAHIVLRVDDPTPLLRFDARGKGRPLVTVPADHTIASPPGGGVVAPRRLSRHDHAGQALPANVSPRLTVKRFRAADTGKGPPNRAAVHLDGVLAGRLEADAWPLAELRLPGPDGEREVAVLLVASEPRRVRIFELDPATP
jgi:hypothetical protein